MRVELVGSSVGKPDTKQYSLTILVNDCIAFDAGCLGFVSPLTIQERVQHVVLSHAHLDHIASLPIFLDNVFQTRSDCPIVYGSDATCHALRTHLFNDVLWPDLIRLSKEESPFLEMQTIRPGESIEIEGLSIEAVALDHAIPTLGYIISDHNSVVGICCDTQPTFEFWERLNRYSRVSAVFVESSFPNSMKWLAQKTHHLTPDDLRCELDKIEHADAQIIAIHLKPAFYDLIVQDLETLNHPRIEVGKPNRVYSF